MAELAQGGGRTALMWNTRSYYKADVIQQEKGKDIVEHERKRAIELKLLIAREKMEDEAKMTEDEIEDELVYLRRVYEREQEEEVKQDEAKPTKSLSDFAKAFKIDETYKEGESFDRELQ
eukprot:gene3932-6082_t